MKWLKKLFGGSSDDSAMPMQDDVMAETEMPDMSGEAGSTEE